MRGVFLDIESLDRGDVDWSGLKALPIEWRFHDYTLPEHTAERVRDAEVVISNKVVLGEAHLAQARRLKLIQVAATGTNNVDLAAAVTRGITVCNVRGYSTPSVVQHVFALLLSLLRSLPEYQAAVRGGQWQRSRQFCLLDFPIQELSGKTLGIVGFGELGQAVAKVAEAFGMRVLVAQRPGGAPQAGRIPLAELLPQVDVLSLHCPLTAETRDLIGATELALLKPGAFLINTARGGIVDEGALVEALRTGHLGGAGIDVLTAEPPVAGNPLLRCDLPTNLIVTPHVAWASRESRQRLLDGLVANIRSYLAGNPINRVA
ncbi:MAG: 2-hydroxyacid dehydrogenase [Pseudomonadota bacterium]